MICSMAGTGEMKPHLFTYDGAEKESPSKASDVISFYFKEMRKLPLLTFEQEQALAKKVQRATWKRAAR